MSMKISNNTIGNLTRDFPACIGVPQSTVPPAACHHFFMYAENNTRAVVFMFSARVFFAFVH